MLNEIPFLLKPAALKSIKLGDNNTIAANMQRRSAWKEGTVGVVPINGVLMQEDSFLAWFFGGATYMGLRKELGIFANDPEIKAIILDINSPGGDAFGCSELAEYIKSIPKPVIAYVSGEAASAAYWLASAANKIVLNKTGFVGSIGAYMAFWDEDKSIYVVSDQSPFKVPDIKTDEGKALIRNHLNTLADHFITDVAIYRGKEKEYVAENFGKGDVVTADNAISVSMADVIGNFATAMSLAVEDLSSTKNIKSKKENKNVRRPSSMARNKLEFVIVDTETITEDVKQTEVTAETIKQMFPEVAQQLIDEGRQGSEAETADVMEAASMADMTDKDESEAVAQAMARKITAVDLTKKLLQIKSAKSKTNSLAKLANDRLKDQPAVADVGGGAPVAIATKNGEITKGFLRQIMGGKK